MARHRFNDILLKAASMFATTSAIIAMLLRAQSKAVRKHVRAAPPQTSQPASFRNSYQAYPWDRSMPSSLPVPQGEKHLL